MEPDELFHLCLFQWTRKLAQLCGVDYFDSNYKPSARTYALFSSLYLLLFSCIWTIYEYPFDRKIICAVIFCFVLQGLVKTHSMFDNTKGFKDLCEFSLKIYRANTNASANKTRLQKSVDLTVFIFKRGMILFFTTSMLTCIAPSITYFFNGELETILPSNFPGINDKEIVGYTCIAVFHAYMSFAFAVGTGGVDLGLMTLVVHTHTMSHIYQNAVNEFNALVVEPKRITDHKYIQASLRNLILMHIDYIKFTGGLKTVFKEMCLGQIAMANLAMIVLIYVILIMDWFPAYFLMATAFFQVFEYSLLGTTVEIANDNMYAAISNISVTDLPTSQQKNLILMILLAQNPHNLTIGGFQSLNVETFVYSMKNTYSVGMLLLSTQMQ